jgi:tripartite-type tricarboxylate transporter receptor subunit TctC
MERRVGVRLWGLAALIVSFACPAISAPWPNRAITIVVPYTAGNNTPDILARLLAHELEQRWAQPVVVENKPGASGNIGTEAVARAAPDGHTLLMAAPAFAQNVGLFKNLPYDPISSFVPIIQAAEVSIALVVNPAVPATDAQQFVDYVKSHPGSLNYGSPGHGTPQHLAMELFRRLTLLDIQHVPYRGLGPAVQDLIAGRVSAMFLPLPPALSLARSGQIRILGIASKRRASIVANVPTLEEQGITGVDVGIWLGLLAPAGTPTEIIDRYNAAINDTLHSAEIGARLRSQAIEVVGGRPERFADVIQTDVVRWLEVIKRGNITLK